MTYCCVVVALGVRLAPTDGTTASVELAVGVKGIVIMARVPSVNVAVNTGGRLTATVGVVVEVTLYTIVGVWVNVPVAVGVSVDVGVDVSAEISVGMMTAFGGTMVTVGIGENIDTGKKPNGLNPPGIKSFLKENNPISKIAKSTKINGQRRFLVDSVGGGKGGRWVTGRVLPPTMAAGMGGNGRTR